jgi:hypothetical protein
LIQEQTAQQNAMQMHGAEQENDMQKHAMEQLMQQSAAAAAQPQGAENGNI